MNAWGNEKANEFWEARLPAGYKDRVERNDVEGGDKASASSTYQQEKFIRDKYERKLWIGDANSISSSPKKSKKKSSKSGTPESQLNKLRRLPANMKCPDCEGTQKLFFPIHKFD